MDRSTSLTLNFIAQRIAALESYQGDTSAVESLNILRHMENLLFRVISTFKLNITSGFKDFKRGELRAYQAAHHGDMRMLFTEKKWILLNAVIVPIPKALHRPYLISASHVRDLLKDAHYPEAIALMTAALDAAWDKATATPAETVNIAQDNLVKLWGTQGYIPEASELKPYIVLTDRGQVEFPARDVFSDLASVAKTAEVILEFEPYFTTTVTQQANLTKLENTVDGMVSKLEQTVKIVEDYLKSLHRLITTLVKFLDAYAAFLQAAQILEHCFVLSLQAFVRA